MLTYICNSKKSLYIAWENTPQKVNRNHPEIQLTRSVSKSKPPLDKKYSAFYISESRQTGFLNFHNKESLRRQK